jgi:hypothetical protein
MDSITRDVIVDLWPLYLSGKASEDTRRLVESFLRDNPAFATEFRRSPEIALTTMERIKRRLAGPTLLLQLAIVFSCIAFGRIVADTSFDVSPRAFIATATVAACFWAAFLVRLFRGRREVLLRVQR